MNKEEIKKELGVSIDNIEVIILPEGKDPADLKKECLNRLIK
tara:strand:- start:263 stop:388 length:126 start_codon:yes stop_codon:yes gene_type:complete